MSKSLSERGLIEGELAVDAMLPDSQIVAAEHLPVGRLLEAFQRARRCCPERFHEFDVTTAGRRLRFQIVGNALTQSVARAFSHIRSNPQDVPDLQVTIWDEFETDVRIDGLFTPGRRRADDVEILLQKSSDGRYLGEKRDQSLSWLDLQTDFIVGCTASVHRRYLDERARPFHKLISAWLHELGVQFVHAGLISIDGTGILYVGNGGAGKSTSSVACLEAGMGYLGDDFVGVERTPQGYVGHSLFSSCLLNVHHLKRFPQLRHHAVAANYQFEDKSIVYLDEVFPGSLERSEAINAIVLPRIVDNATTTFGPAGKAEALFAIAPTSVMFLPQPSQTAFDRLADMVGDVPTYWLNLGRDIQSIPAAVRDLASTVRH